MKINDFDFELFKSLRAISLNNAIDRKFEAWYASICRWYSRNFYTPLPQVEEMNPNEVLRVYYEDSYWSLARNTDEDAQAALQAEIRSVLMLNDPKAAEEEAEAQLEDDAWMEEELSKLRELHGNSQNPNLAGEMDIIEVNEELPDPHMPFEFD